MIVTVTVLVPAAGAVLLPDGGPPGRGGVHQGAGPRHGGGGAGAACGQQRDTTLSVHQPTVVQGAMDPLPPEAAGPLELPVAGLRRRIVIRLLSLCSSAGNGPS